MGVRRVPLTKKQNTEIEAQKAEQVRRVPLTPEQNTEMQSQNPVEPKTSESFLQRLARTPRPYLEIGGDVAGEVLGAPFGPTASAGASGVGYATGSRSADFLESLADVHKYGTPEEEVAKTMKLMGVGAGSNVAGRFLAKGMSKLYNKAYPKRGRPDMEDIKQLAEKEEIPLTPADATESRPIAMVEGALRSNISSAGIAQDFDRASMKALEAYKGRTLKKIGTSIDLYDAGKAVQDAGGSRRKLWKDASTKAYAAVDEALPPDLSMDMSATKALIKKEIENYGSVSGGQVPVRLKKLLKVIEGDESTWLKMMNERKGVGQLQRVAYKASQEEDGRIWTLVKQSIDDDMAKFADDLGSNVKEVYDLARAIHRTGIDGVPGANVYKDKAVQKLLLKLDPEKVVNMFMRPNNNTQIRLVSEAIGPEGMKAAKSAWLTRITSQGAENSFSPRKFAQAFDKYTEKDLKAFLTAEERKGLKDFYKISRQVNQVDKLAGNPSGTGQRVNTSYTLYALIRHPIATIGSLMGSRKFAEKYFNDSLFRQKLIQGLNTTSDDMRKSQLIGEIFALAGLDHLTGYSEKKLAPPMNKFMRSLKNVNAAPVEPNAIAPQKQNVLTERLNTRKVIP